MKTDTRLIPLTQGKFAIVNSVDYDFLSQFNWYANKHHTENSAIWYAVRNEKNPTPGPRQVKVYLHRVVAQRAGLPWCRQYDHKNRDGLDCRRENLRPSTRSQNAANRRKIYGCISRLKGVSWHKRNKKWCSQCKSRWLGYFDSEQEAHEAYKRAALKYFGEFAHF